MARPKPKAEETFPLNFRMPKALLTRVDACHKRMESSIPGLNRADVIRSLIVLGLEAEERLAKKES